MSITNNVSIVIDEEAMKNINAAIETIRKNLPALINLTNEQRQTIPKMGDKTVAFVNKSFEYASQNSGIAPKYLNMTEFGKDVEATNKLFQIAMPLQKLQEELNDTILLSGSEAYLASLAFYGSLKAALAAGEVGLKNIYDDLSSRFPGRPSNKSKEAKAATAEK